MRLAAQAKLGFYPIGPRAVDALLRHLGPADPAATLIDPCCGQGAALAQVGDGLGIPGGRRWAVELDEARAGLAREANPGATVLGPCSFLGTRASGGCFSLAYVNPPFDDELGGGGREEERFCYEAGRLLVPGGVLALVLPERVLAARVELVVHLASWFEDVAGFDLPAEARPFGEVCVLGRRRRDPLPERETHDEPIRHLRTWQSDLGFPVLGEDVGRRYPIPRGRAPAVFEKADLTEVEAREALAASPLWRRLEPAGAAAKVAPPLALREGHIALLLASGHLDGVVAPPGEPPHAVRGTARKDQYVKEETESYSEDGKSKTSKTVKAERIILTVRVADQAGNITTFE
jgi:hypothetical protein